MTHTDFPRLTPMKQVDFWRWRYFDPVGFQWTVTGSVMSEADAKQQFPDAEKVEGSLETRWVPENETYANTVSAFMEGSSKDRQ